MFTRRTFCAIFLSLFLMGLSGLGWAESPYPHSDFIWVHSQTGPASAKTNEDIQYIGGLQLEDYQVVNLLLAKNLAERFFPQTRKSTPEEARNYILIVMSIMWQESKAGAVGPVGDMQNPFGERSYGLMQIKRRTADKMLRQHPDVAIAFFGNRNPPDEEMIAALIYNPKFNITIACLYLDYLHMEYRLSWANTITAYNRGYGGASRIHFRRRHYTKEVIRHRRAMTHIVTLQPQ